MGHKDELSVYGRRLVAPLVEVLTRKKVSPNLVTVVGFLISIGASILYAEGLFRLGALVLFMAGLADVIDGDLARSRNMVSKSGALLDSTLDRVADAFFFGALMWYYFPRPSPFVIFFFSWLFSFLVSYVRARGEGLGLSVRAGPMDRSGRFFFIVVASLIGKRIFVPLMIVFLILTFLTVARRFLLLYNALRQGGKI